VLQEERPGTRIPNQPFGFLNLFSWLARCWRDNITYEGGMSLVWMNGLLLVPFGMAAFFYPLEAFILGASVVLVSFVVFQGCMIWRKRHPARPDAMDLPRRT
jgi:hypothetical protein